MAMNISTAKAAEIIQTRFRFNKGGEVIGCPDRYMSDLLGSDWAPEGVYLDNSTPVEVFYRMVRAKAERIYGPLPY